MNASITPLIVGAGPVGLGAALFLRRAGVAARIIEKAEQPSRHSKALAVNPRTLEILEPLGITDKMLALGLPVRRARFWRDGKVIGELGFERLKHKYPFMLALSQATTERLLNEALEDNGGIVERGTELVTCGNCAEGVQAELKHGPEASSEIVKCRWLLAADGSHSTVRRALNVDFSGSSFAKPWHLADVPLKTPLEPNIAHAFLYTNGFLFLIRVIDDASSHSANPAVWRVISNRPELLKEIPNAELCGSPVWESEFHISHRVNTLLQAGNAYFAGDAAHIHSPLGARGMNLGLEDAWVFSELVKRGQMRRYAALRKPVDQQVVKRVERLSRIALGQSTIARLVRCMGVRLLLKVPLVQRRMVPTLTGLDHDLEPQQRASSRDSERKLERPQGVARRERGHAH